MRKVLFPLLIFYFFSVSGQETNLTDLLADFEKKGAISFAFDAELIAGAKIPADIKSPSDLQKYFDQNSALSLLEVSEGQYIIAPKSVKVKISLDGEPLSDAEVFQLAIIDRSNKVLFQSYKNDLSPIAFDWQPKPNDTIKIVSTAHENRQFTTKQLLFDLDKKVVLQDKLTFLQEVIVKGYLAKGVNMNLSSQNTELKMDDLALIPGETDGDVLAALTTIPGVNTPDSRSGNLYIRGSAPDQNLTTYNDIPMYHRGHYFGTISPYQSALIEDIEISKNGSAPSTGGRVGGTIAIHSQRELEDYDEIGLGLNTLYGNAFLKKRLGKKVAIGVSFRKSLPSSWLSPKLQQISEMVYSGTVLSDPRLGVSLSDIVVDYQDANLNLVWDVNSQNKLRASFVQVDNFTAYQTGNMTSNTEEHAFINSGASIIWDRNFPKEWQGSLVAAVSDYSSDYEGEILSPQGLGISIQQSENTVYDGAVSMEIKRKIVDQNELSFGLSTQHIEVETNRLNTEREAAPIQIRQKTIANLQSAFVNYEHLSWSSLYFQMGARAEYYSQIGRSFLSPRLLLNYDLGRNSTIKGSLGRKYQYLNQAKYLQFGNAGFDNELWLIANGTDVSVMRSDQAMLGWIFKRNKILLDVELYEKRIDNINYANTFRLQPNTQFSEAQWQVSGLDFFSKVQVRDNFALWGSYEFASHLVVFDSATSVKTNYKYNRPHRLKLGGLLEHKHWKFSYSYKLLAGLSGRSVEILTELDQVVVPASSGMSANQMPPAQQRSAELSDLPERYPIFTSFDLFVTKSFPKTKTRNWKGVIGLSLINIFNNENQLDQVIRGANSRNLVSRYGLGFSPNISFNISW